MIHLYVFHYIKTIYFNNTEDFCVLLEIAEDGDGHQQ